ncbi:MFS transporter [Pseudogemmobacter faecipullorum]|uniref:MFS transporter n=1 Tax=Pseudogemmobacter faecipullorum TaxID=2755041 RepID=A0ABS8CID9_9RHOB|nr:MFS transporter [Pseudogemmobacter faecipullorum]MCB5408620.1 MFS transporter [Pseudogemmobacter faecipullorum]
MALRYIPLALKYNPVPQTEHFALLTGLEACVRGVLVSAMPLAIYRTLGDAQSTSLAYLVAGFAGLFCGLMVPVVTRHLPRRWTYTLGVVLYLLGMTLALYGTPFAMILALCCNAFATATVFICLNAYVLDYVDRSRLGHSQGMQMAYAAVPWTLGPVLGVWLYDRWPAAPFLVAGGFALVLLAVFWWLRLGNGRQIARARKPAVNPLGFLAQFFRQPRLIAGWLFAVTRSAGWWVYIVYLPIYCVEAGLSDKVGGFALSLSNGFLFLAPVINRIARRMSVRRSVRLAFLWGGGLMLAAWAFAALPWLVVFIAFGASLCFLTLDVVGGLPFLMAVKPSQRTEMAAVYTTFRDVSGILTPAVAWGVLFFTPVSGLFAAMGLAMLACWQMAGHLHPRLGAERPSRGGTP